jgi:hypothetical protein
MISHDCSHGFRVWVLFTLALILALLPAQAPAASPLPAPAWTITSLPTPTIFVPGDTDGDYSYDVRVANIGAAASDGSPVSIIDTLPKGLTVTDVDLKMYYAGKPATQNPVEFGYGAEDPEWELCEEAEAAGTAIVTCTLPEEFPAALVAEFPPTENEPSAVRPGAEVRMVIHVSVPSGTPEELLTNKVQVEGGGASAASTSQNKTTNEQNPQLPPGGLTFFDSSLTEPDGSPAQQAGSHPYQYTTSFAVNTKPSAPGSAAAFVPAGGDIKDVPVTLPPGLVGNPNAAERCTAQEFNEFSTLYLGPGTFFSVNDCPDGAAVGYVRLQQVEGTPGILPVPLYNLVPPPGMPAQFGFQILGLPFFIDTEVRPEESYRVVAAARNVSQAKRVTAAAITVWGVPADPSHDPLRGRCLNELPELAPISLGDCSAGIEARRPLLRLPTSCGSPFAITMSFDTWTTPGSFLSETNSLPPLGGCERLSFEPSLEARPITEVADSPSGLKVNLHLPQNEDPDGLATADLRDTIVALPPGLTVNPSGANGLGACSPSQVGLTSKSPAIFNNASAHCPDASKIGTVEVLTPLIDHPLKGAVFAAAPYDNPFDSLLAIYVVVEDPKSGLVIKLPGKVVPDPATGQLTSTFENTPQTPFENFKLDFFDGPRAVLRSPAVCASYRTNSSLTPWSAPQSGPPAVGFDSWSISRPANGGECPSSEADRPNTPAFAAGTVSPQAKAYSPLVVNLSREDGSQEFSALTVDLPPGVLGKLAGISSCSDAALEAAAAKTGKAERETPSCPAASEVGRAIIGAGAGPAPYYTTGKAYLAGPYKGAPLSIAIVTPATAGPYDLGAVVVRSAIYIDPETAKIKAVSDPIPHILDGIPLDLRSVALRLDRANFILNPTNCDEMPVAGELRSILGQVAALRGRFQASGCSHLRFKPKLSLRLRGKTHRAGHPSLRAVLTMPPGGSNIAKVSVALPRSEFLEQAHIRTVCTRVQFSVHACPAGAIYGYVTATSPLVDYPLVGPVYLRSSNNPLPDLVAVVRGPASQPIEVSVVGRIDSVNGGLRATFSSFPDAPVSKVVLNMRGGKRGLLVNSRNICRGSAKAVVKFAGQNDKLRRLRPILKVRCPR